MDCNSKGIFCWIGENCTLKEKKTTIDAAIALMLKQKYPNYLPFETVIDGAETTAFKSYFKEWK